MCGICENAIVLGDHVSQVRQICFIGFVNKATCAVSQPEDGAAMAVEKLIGNPPSLEDYR